MESNQELYKALSNFQAEVPEIPKNKQGYGYKYASLDSILSAIRPLLAKNGLCVFQGLQYSEDGKEFVHTTIAHESGQFIESRLLLRVAKPDSQALGAAITYGRRYLLCAMLNLQADEDTDGESGSDSKPQKTQGEKKASEKQIGLILSLLNGNKERLVKICEHYGVNYIEQVTIAQAGDIIEKLTKDKGE